MTRARLVTSQLVDLIGRIDSNHYKEPRLLIWKLIAPGNERSVLNRKGELLHEGSRYVRARLVHE